MASLPRSIKSTATFCFAYGPDAGEGDYPDGIATFIADKPAAIARLRERFPAATVLAYLHPNYALWDTWADAETVEACRLRDMTGAPVMNGSLSIMDPSSKEWLDAVVARARALTTLDGAHGIFVDVALMSPVEVAPDLTTDDECFLDWTARQVAWAGALKRKLGSGVPVVANCGGRPGWDSLALLVDGILWEEFVASPTRTATGAEWERQFARLRAGQEARPGVFHFLAADAPEVPNTEHRDYCVASMLLAANPWTSINYQVGESGPTDPLAEVPGLGAPTEEPFAYEPGWHRYFSPGDGTTRSAWTDPQTGHGGVV